ncbi:MAG: DNA/RNA nuclease SfsA [Clostridiaceae bacterium]
MKFIKDTIRAKFINRPNRFQAYVEYEGEVIMVHVPNTGRIREILIPGCTVILRKEDNPARKTAFTLIAAYKGMSLINIDSQIPNRVVEEALLEGRIEKLKGYTNVKREKFYKKSRFDFLLENDEGEKYYLEVKGVTLEHEGKASFPDAVTERGARHISELMEAKKEGYGAGIIFVLQMENMISFTPAWARDPLFSSTLKKAEDFGIDILAYECKVTETSLDLTSSVEVRIGESPVESLQ